MWPWSRNSECGSATETLLMLAPPWGMVRVALNFGWLPLWVPPKRLKASFGLKERLAQSPTWKGAADEKSESSAVESRLPPTPVIRPFTDIGEQLVGLSVVLGRSIRSLTSLVLRITPCRIVGKGSDTAFTWVLSELT